MVKDDVLTLRFAGGPCDGRTAEVAPKDSGLTVEAAPFKDHAVVLGRLALPGTEGALGARGKWQVYRRDDEDPFLYHHVIEDDVSEFMYDPSNSGDEWVWADWTGDLPYS